MLAGASCAVGLAENSASVYLISEDYLLSVRASSEAIDKLGVGVSEEFGSDKGSTSV